MVWAGRVGGVVREGGGDGCAVLLSLSGGDGAGGGG